MLEDAHANLRTHGFMQLYTECATQCALWYTAGFVHTHQAEQACRVWSTTKLHVLQHGATGIGLFMGKTLGKSRNQLNECLMLRRHGLTKPASRHSFFNNLHYVTLFPPKELWDDKRVNLTTLRDNKAKKQGKSGQKAKTWWLRHCAGTKDLGHADSHGKVGKRHGNPWNSWEPWDSVGGCSLDKNEKVIMESPTEWYNDKIIDVARPIVYACKPKITSLVK